MNKTLTRIFLITVVVGLAATLAVACGRPHHRGMSPEKVDKFVTWKVNDFLDDLEATDAQRTEILAMKDRVFEDVRKLKEEARGDRLEILAQMKRDEPEAKRLHTLLDNRIEKFRAFAHQELDNLLSVHASLTPGQRAQIVAKIEEHAKEHNCSR